MDRIDMLQVIFYIMSPLITFMAVAVAYIALLRQSRPHILVQYRPDKDVASIIALEVINIGGGMAREVAFSRPLPVHCWGIEKPDGPGKEALGDGIPAIAAGQSLVFQGGQYSGLSERIGNMLEVKISYKFTNPLGFTSKRTEKSILSVSHIKLMPSHDSADHKIIDALTGTNRTTVRDIRDSLKGIQVALDQIVENNKPQSGN